MLYQLKKIKIIEKWTLGTVVYKNLLNFIHRQCFMDNVNRLTPWNVISYYIDKFEKKTCSTDFFSNTGRIIIDQSRFDEIIHCMAWYLKCQLAQDQFEHLYIYGGLCLCDTIIVK